MALTPTAFVALKALNAELYVFLAFMADGDTRRAAQALSVFQADWNRYGQIVVNEYVPRQNRGALPGRVVVDGRWGMESYRITGGLLALSAREYGLEPSAIQSYPSALQASQLGAWFERELRPLGYRSRGEQWYQQLQLRPVEQIRQQMSSLMYEYIRLGGNNMTSAMATLEQRVTHGREGARTGTETVSPTMTSSKDQLQQMLDQARAAGKYPQDELADRDFIVEGDPFYVSGELTAKKKSAGTLLLVGVGALGLTLAFFTARDRGWV